MRQFRHLRMLKRAGLGVTSEPLESTALGGYAVDCPACPHPGINLPAGWENEPMDTAWVYGLNLTIDANFRLKNKDRQLDYDLPLGDGWGHWVPETPYRAHLQANVDEPEVDAFGIVACLAHTVTISPTFATRSCEQWTMPTNVALKGMFPPGSQELSALGMASFVGTAWGTCKKEKGTSSGDTLQQIIADVNFVDMRTQTLSF